jgi:phosphatidylserine decarboxylase
MKLHKEGKIVLPVAASILAVILFAIYAAIGFHIVFRFLFISAVIFFGMMAWFFRNPARLINPDSGKVLAAADGDIVEILRITEKEYFNDERIQVSVFMSIFNVHINRIPVEGEIIYQNHINGRFFPAFVKRSSEENERCSTVIKLKNGQEILVRQIAGIVARRIRTYKKPGDRVSQTEQLGFIRFGSRVDIFLPLSSHVEVVHHQKSVGGQTIIATL